MCWGMCKGMGHVLGDALGDAKNFDDVLGDVFGDPKETWGMLAGMRRISPFFCIPYPLLAPLSLRPSRP